MSYYPHDPFENIADKLGVKSYFAYATLVFVILITIAVARVVIGQIVDKYNDRFENENRQPTKQSW